MKSHHSGRRWPDCASIFQPDGYRHRPDTRLWQAGDAFRHRHDILLCLGTAPV